MPGAWALRFDNDPSFRFQARGRVVAIGDLHGDLQAAQRALRTARAIDDAGRWIGGELVVVQVGDEIDRGDQDREVIELFQSLREEAAHAGGAVHPLIGNHETMNVAGDFRYATSRGLSGFRGAGDGTVPTPVLAQFPPAQRDRAAALSPGGPCARKLATRNVVIMVGDTVFVHGALKPDHVRYGIGRINREAAAWMRGEGQQPEIIAAGSGPTWQGSYSHSEDGDAPCAMLQEVLGMIHARRMVVGHTMQAAGITSGCGGRIWSVDVGLGKHYGPQSSEILELEGEAIRVLSDPAVATKPAAR